MTSVKCCWEQMRCEARALSVILEAPASDHDAGMGPRGCLITPSITIDVPRLSTIFIRVVCRRLAGPVPKNMKTDPSQ